MPDQTQNLAVTLFSEILAVDQLARANMGKVLPKGMELSHFSVLKILHSLYDLASCVHYERTVCDNGFVEWLSV